MPAPRYRRHAPYAAMNSRQRLLAHLAGQPVDRLPLLPITMQFAADVASVSYRRYATDYRVLVDAQLRTAEQFGFDHVSCISDPAREAADCGATVVFTENGPPAFNEADALLADKTGLARLTIPDPHGGGRMTDRVQAAALFREKLAGQLGLEGWVEGPIAQAADLRGINTLMLDFFDDPGFVRELFTFVVAMELRFARAQIEAGVDWIGIGDAAASLVGPALYHEFVWPFEKQLVDGIHALGSRVRLHICGNTTALLADMGRLGADIVDLDYFAEVGEARQRMGPAQVLLGNLAPVALLRNGTPAGITEALAACHHAAGPRFVVGAGCELPRDTPAANVRALVDYALTHQP
jgi:MtaA/CmuA family methyltransferase